MTWDGTAAGLGTGVTPRNTPAPPHGAAQLLLGWFPTATAPEAHTGELRGSESVNNTHNFYLFPFSLMAFGNAVHQPQYRGHDAPPRVTWSGPRLSPPARPDGPAHAGARRAQREDGGAQGGVGRAGRALESAGRALARQQRHGAAGGPAPRRSRRGAEGGWGVFEAAPGRLRWVVGRWEPEARPERRRALRRCPVVVPGAEAVPGSRPQ